MNKTENTPGNEEWNSEESQGLRYRELLKVVDSSGAFSLLDYGCGYGSLFGFVKQVYPDFSYTGFDSSAPMIEEAQKMYKEQQAVFTSSSETLNPHDYVVASGIFNVRLEKTDLDWQSYIHDTLFELNRLSSKGFAFNMLTSYADKELMKDYLYYANPLVFFDHCKRNFSTLVALHHDYPLHEFTILVRK